MRSNGLATLLLMIPVLTVPALAIFGIPQFAPVVASPLDEGRDIDRESRVGNSAKQSHDDFFGDVDGFGSEPSDNDDPPQKHRNSTALSGAKSRENIRRPIEKSARTWGDEAEPISERPNRPSRRSSIPDFDESPEHDVRSSKGSIAAERLSRERQRQSQKSKPTDPIRLVSTTDMGRGRSRAEPEDDTDSYPKIDRNPKNGSRSRPTDSRSTPRRDVSADKLTWATAMERLKQFDIRNFRLEPGHQPGLYLFICSYTPPESPLISYRFEAEADEPLGAVEKVLEQIAERWQAR